MSDKHQLRAHLRRQRRKLSLYQQRIASRDLQQLICQQALFLTSRRIAFYLANDGEIDPACLLARAHKLGKQCYLPLLQKNRTLLFARYKPGDKLINNRFQIPEPISKELLRPHQLDMVLMPLVGFDKLGGRLGMGGGFYDRSFAFKCKPGIQRFPQLIGLAHTCQEVAEIPMEKWDIPLQAIATNRSFITIT